jgi:hypothetical protein
MLLFFNVNVNVFNVNVNVFNVNVNVIIIQNKGKGIAIPRLNFINVFVRKRIEQLFSSYQPKSQLCNF